MVSILNSSSTTKFAVYPLPLVGDTLFLSAEDDVKVFDHFGRLIHREYNVDEINFRGFKPGVYYIKVTSGESCRFVIN
jgi:hypothetical protein